MKRVVCIKKSSQWNPQPSLLEQYGTVPYPKKGEECVVTREVINGYALDGYPQDICYRKESFRDIIERSLKTEVEIKEPVEEVIDSEPVNA